MQVAKKASGSWPASEIAWPAGPLLLGRGLCEKSLLLIKSAFIGLFSPLFPETKRLIVALEEKKKKSIFNYFENLV